MVDVHDLDAAAEPIRPRLRPLLLDEIFTLPPRKTFVKRLLGRGELSLWYGEPGCGKSFLLTDLGLHIAHGWPWFDRKTDQGLVVYIAAEGAGGFQHRIAAFLRHYEIDDRTAPFTLVPTTADLLNGETDTSALITEIEFTARRVEQTPLLIVVDTLSRCIVGGNENGPEDMGAFISNCDRFREVLGAHVAIIHHAGKDGSRGARGHSSLYGAVDTQIEVIKRAAGNTATVTKQKDDPDGDVLSFRLEQVVLDHDEEDEPITSCVVLPSDEDIRKSDRPRVRGATKVALDLLTRAIADNGETVPASSQTPANATGVRVSLWRKYCNEGQISDSDSPDARKKAFKRAAVRLQELGVIGIWNDWVWLT